MKNVWIVIPALNEQATVGDVVRSLQSNGFEHILVVDDGSSDGTERIASQHGARVVRHSINRGVGAAIVTGMRCALMNGADVVVTFDADGQHDPRDIEKLLGFIGTRSKFQDSRLQDTRFKEVEVVLGVREDKSAMPLVRRLANAIANFVTWLLSGLWVRDSQSGLRAYTRHAVEKMDLHANGYEFCTEVIREIHYRKLPFVQVPVRVQYTARSLAKGQSFDAGIGTLAKLIVRSLMR